MIAQTDHSNESGAGEMKMDPKRAGMLSIIAALLTPS
jgi:hypothetical protein